MVGKTGENINEITEKSLLFGFEPIKKENGLPGFEKLMKQVETLRKRLQSESLPYKSPFGKRRKNSIEVNKKQSSELSAKEIAGGDLNISESLMVYVGTFGQNIGHRYISMGPVGHDIFLGRK